MTALLVLIPVSLILMAVAVGTFFWAVNRGQFDDLDTPALRILEDDLPQPAVDGGSEAAASQDGRPQQGHGPDDSPTSDGR